MTSGQFQSVAIDSIWVDRDKRQRRDVSNVADLLESIPKVGLINPPVISRDGELRAGERRWNACKQLGWTSIAVQWVDELDEVQLHLLELDENIRRVDLPWQDECLAVKRYHELKRQLDPAWTAERTGEAIGMAGKNVAAKISVAEAIEAKNQRVIEAPLYSTARGIVERDTSRKKDSILSNISFASPKTEGQAAVAEVHRPTVPLLNADFHEWAIEYDGPKFNFIHCDFPYGVGMDKSDQGAGDGHGTYEDSPDVYWELLERFVRTQHRFVADSAHLMLWFSMDYYSQTISNLMAAGWRVNPFPLIWMKSDGTGILPDPKRGPRRIYETAFFGSRGDRNVVKPKANAFAHPGKDKSLHMNEKPVPMLKHFMEMFCDEYSVVLDPTAGSANALKAASLLGANFVLGLERDPEFFQRSVEGYYDVQP